MKQKDCYNTSKLAFHVFVKREKIPHVQFIRAYSESGGKTPLIKWSCEVRLRTQTFGFQKKKPPVSIEYEAGRSQETVWSFRRR
jgi:hypothetical protein